MPLLQPACAACAAQQLVLACLLQIAIKESNVSSHPSNIPIAKAALQQLLALVQAKRDKNDSAEPSRDDSFALTEADVLKTMVKVHQQVRLHWCPRQLKLELCAPVAGCNLPYMYAVLALHTYSANNHFGAKNAGPVKRAAYFNASC